MKQVLCTKCNAQTDLNETYTLNNKIVCRTCAFDKASEIPGFPFSLKKNRDPEVCFHCNGVSEKSHYRQYNGLPTCSKCERLLFKRRIWISGLLLLLAVLGLFFYNLFQTKDTIHLYMMINNARTAILENNLHDAQKHLNEASILFPDKAETRGTQAFLDGIQHLENYDNTAALAAFKIVSNTWDPFGEIDIHILITEMNKAFDENNYILMYENSCELQNYSDKVAGTSLLQASAAACMYAVTDEPSYKNEALEIIKSFAFIPDDMAKVLIPQIKYRLDSKEIIPAQEFYARFPDGYPIPKEGSR